jgi:radical SAM superfamily enzyme YgiQ (UPF0313 family)
LRIALVRLTNDDVAAAQPLGIMALEAYLRQQGRGDVHMVDMQFQRDGDSTVRAVLALRPDVVGLSGLTPQRRLFRHLSAGIKRANPGTLVVAGGPHPTSDPADVLATGDVDYAVLGEGEVTFSELLREIDGGVRPEDLPGTAVRRGDAVVTNPPRAPIEDLDTLPMASWDRIDLDAYRKLRPGTRLTTSRWASLFHSRGCPYRCAYCHDVFGKKFRRRSARLVLDEIRLLVEDFGVRELRLEDDIFNLDRARALEICRGISGNGWPVAIAFHNGLRADLMDPELLEAMKEAGVRHIAYAIETATPRLQVAIGKRLDLAKATRMIDMTAAAGILTGGFFMLGLPGETRREAWRTVRFALRSRLHRACFFLFCPFAGTQYGELLPRENRPEMNYSRNPVSVAKVSAFELAQIRRIAYLAFFLDPRRAMRLLRVLPSEAGAFRALPLLLKQMLGL